MLVIVAFKFITHLLQGAEEGLESGKVPDQLEDPHDPHHPNQSDDFSGFAHYLEVLKNQI